MFYDSTLTKELFTTSLEQIIVKLQTERTFSTIPIWFSSGLFDWLTIDEEVAFIAVLDGLDQIGLTAEDAATYQKRVQDLRQSLGNEKHYEMACLVTMRHHTYRTGFTDRVFTQTFDVNELSHVSAYDIWKGKLRLLQNPVPRTIGAEQLSSMAGSRYRQSLAEICEIFASLVSYSLTYSMRPVGGSYKPMVDTTGGFAILEDLFGADRRALFRSLARVARFLFQHHASFFERTIDHLLAIADGAQEFVGNIDIKVDPESELRGILRYHYLVIEALFLRTPTSDYCVPGYLFSWDDDELKIRRADQTAHTLYNIFYYPFRANRPRHIEFLVGVRILQYLRFKGNVADRRDVESFLPEAFGYQTATVRGKIEFLLEAGLVSFQLVTGGSVRDIAITSQGNFYLDRLLHSVEYLSLACQAVPLPDQIIERCFPLLPYRNSKAVAYNKFICVINFCRAIAGVERHEEAVFNSFAMKNPGEVGSFRRFGNDIRKTFSITSQIHPRVEGTLTRMLASAESSYPEGYRDMLTVLNPDLRHWQL